MSELAYLFCSQYDGSGDLIRRFEGWLIARHIPADVMRVEVSAFIEVLDELMMSAP